MMDTVSLLLVIIGAVNWLLVGIFQFDLVSCFWRPGGGDQPGSVHAHWRGGAVVHIAPVPGQGARPGKGARPGSCLMARRSERASHAF